MHIEIGILNRSDTFRKVHLMLDNMSRLEYVHWMTMLNIVVLHEMRVKSRFMSDFDLFKVVSS